VLGGRYRVGETLGRGAFATVHSALDLKLERPVAVKLLRSTRDRPRFIREAKALARLYHPNIVAIHDAGSEPGQDYLVMERVEGTSLGVELEGGPMPWDRLARIAADAAAALHHAHFRGIVHRDVKPSNILLAADGTVKVSDFGVARIADFTALTPSGTTPGTLAYMAPELFRGDDVDARADVWSLGVLLFQRLTGELPFDGDIAGSNGVSMSVAPAR
jgi:serine/threonine-protein kinase